ncbi:MAG: macB 7, partial [Phycisphaerales bacterium]|nr:macB 7 [Phycisphaerales bacterium]
SKAHGLQTRATGAGPLPVHSGSHRHFVFVFAAGPVMFVRKLVLSNLVTRKARVVLTVAAVALSVSLVVSVTTGYASVLGAINAYVEKFLGSIDAQVSRTGDPRGGVSTKVVAALKADPAVKRADARVEVVTPLTDGEGKALEGKMATVIGIARPGDTRIESLRLYTGKFFDADDGDVVVVDQALAEQQKLKVGSKIGLAGERKVTLTVVAVAHKPEVLAQHMQTIYVPLKTLQRFQGWDAAAVGGEQVNRVLIEFARGTDPEAFAARWRDKLPSLDPNAKLKLTRDVRKDLDKNLVAVELMSYLGGAVSMLAATFIVFSALSMGVAERQRTLAMLRAVGASRGQVGALVVVEGALLGGIGAVAGLPLGWLWVKVLTLMYPDVFTAGVVLNWGGVALGVGGSVIAALAASVLPAWQATRVSPLEALSPDAAVPSGGTPIWAAVIGVVLIGLDPLILFGPVDALVRAAGAADVPAVAKDVRLVLHFILGLPGIMLGFFLLGPLVVKVVEFAFGSAVASAAGLRPALLRQQLSSGLWRAAGTAAALMVGLSVLVTMQIQGKTAMGGWQLPTKFPDLFIVSPPGSSLGSIFGQGPKQGVEVDQVKTLEKVEGIRAGEIMPIAIASPQYGHGAIGFLGAALDPEATMFFGIDPAKAFKMMELEFREGSATVAEKLLQDGQAVWLKAGQTAVPQVELVEVAADGKAKTRKGVTKVGDQYAVQGTVTRAAGGSGDYAVAMPGRPAPILVPAAAVDRVDHGRFLIITNEFKELKGLGVGDAFAFRRTDGKPVQYTVVGVVWSPGIDVIVSVFDMGRQFDQRTANSVFGSVRDAKEDFGVERIYLFAANLEWNVQRDDIVKRVNKQLRTEGMKAGDVRQIKENIVKAFDRLLLLASTVAFAALAVASLGVTNTVMAGIRTRRWQFGVLRSIGVTRGQLLRLVLAEAVLLGLVACGLGLGAGAVMAADAHKLQVIMTGYNPPFLVPWGVVAAGCGIVLLIAVGASLWPAVNVARTEPLRLLQAG